MPFLLSHFPYLIFFSETLRADSTEVHLNNCRNEEIKAWGRNRSGGQLFAFMSHSFIKLFHNSGHTSDGISIKVWQFLEFVSVLRKDHGAVFHGLWAVEKLFSVYILFLPNSLLIHPPSSLKRMTWLKPLFVQRHSVVAAWSLQKMKKWGVMIKVLAKEKSKTEPLVW